MLSCQCAAGYLPRRGLEKYLWKEERKEEQEERGSRSVLPDPKASDLSILACWLWRVKTGRRKSEKCKIVGGNSCYKVCTNNMIIKRFQESADGGRVRLVFRGAGLISGCRNEGLHGGGRI